MKKIAASIALCAFVGFGLPQKVFADDALAPPPGSKLLINAQADGVQVYVCTPKDNGFVWVFDGPAATLFSANGREIGTHGKGPIWTLGDGSAITAETVAEKASAQPGSIASLLLKVKTHVGTYGQLSGVTYVRRIDAKGGAEPAAGCDSAHQGDIARMRYSANYQFFAP